jgi:thiol-disulfide isomerase/thioredoxin
MKSAVYVCFLILIISSCGDADIQKIQLVELNGSKVVLSDYKGKTVFINVWATWCGPCVKEMPTIDKAQAALKDNDVVFLFASNEGAAEINEFIQSRSFPFHYVRLLNLEELNIPALPTTYIFDGDGNLKFSETGTRDWSTPGNINLITQ